MNSLYDIGDVDVDTTGAVVEESTAVAANDVDNGVADGEDFTAVSMLSNRASYRCNESDMDRFCSTSTVMVRVNGVSNSVIRFSSIIPAVINVGVAGGDGAVTTVDGVDTAVTVAHSPAGIDDPVSNKVAVVVAKDVSTAGAFDS
jgi:hypothetical protein